MNRLRGIVRVAATILLVLAAVALCSAVAHYVAAFLFSRAGPEPGSLVRQLVVSVLAFLLLLFVMGLSALITMPRRMAIYNAILDAMRRLSRGDFSVNLDIKTGPDNQFGQLVQSFNDMTAQLGALERMRQEFISNVSHEIQSPLTSIIGFARALRSPGLSEEERAHYLEIIEAESVRLSRLSDSLLKLTSLESEHHPFVPARYRLDKQLRDVILSHEPQWLAKSIDLCVDLKEVEVTADYDLMNQVWGNLLQNSIKFTPPGGTISVSLELEAEEAAVRISDTGIGIGEEDLPHIFERFYKADKSRNRSGGSGLGLSIVKRIIELHSGSIDVQSRLGEGTTFTVRLRASG